MEAHKALLLLLVLPSSILAGPVSWLSRSNGNECHSTCSESNNFGYEVGRMYRYSYEVTGISNIQGASDQLAKVFTSAVAQIHVISKCEMALTLTDVSFKTSDPDSSSLTDLLTDGFEDLLGENPLYFSFQDGRIEALCPGTDSKDVLNFKRGVLSAFQNSMNQHKVDQSLREIDISGNCPTEYTIQKGWKSTQISKTKDLLGCSDRQHYKTSLQSTPFHIPNAIQSLPLLKGELKCDQVVQKKGVLSKTTCTESLVFRPFSRKESGAKAETIQKLELISTQSRPSLMRMDGGKKTSLLFEHGHSMSAEDEEMWTVKDKIEEMCRMSANGISKQVPGLFTEMVYLMKELSYDALNDLWAGVSNGLFSSDNKERAKEFVLDGLPMVGTQGSVKLMVDLLLSEEVTGIRSTLWLKSFAFLQHPNMDMIKDSFPRLLTSEKLRLDSLLPVTSAIHAYCLQQENCQTLKGVKDVVEIMEDILGRDCKSSDENLILTTLRAVGNLGFSDNLVATLENCMEMSGNNMNVRVAAAQAYTGVTCQAKRTGLMDMFGNKEEDSELRINAYWNLMKCPTDEILINVQYLLENEEINQVGSFVWTHLTNLAETSSPHKQELKRILQDEKLKKAFNMDKRKFSRNYELSFFSDRVGLGGVSESNIIWSSSSFLPRSAMLNLTVDVLGHSVNLFEAGGRVQGLQQILQDYIANKLKDSQSKNPSSCGKQEKMNKMNDKHSVDDEELKASMYLRMFGNELEFKHLTMKDIMAMKNKFNTNEMISKLAKGQDISVTHSAMFLDSTVTVPTIAGMALQLSINGTASVQLKAKAKMDLRRMSLKRMEINFDLSPSGAVQFGGEMTLNAWIMKSGLKMTSTLHSSTAFKGSVDLTNGQVLKVTADTPGDKLELFDMQSEFFIVHNKVVRPQKMLESKAAIQQRGCSDQYWVKIMGYQLCGQVSFVNATMIKDAPYFPLTGPKSASVVMHKRDAPQGLKLTVENIMNSDSSLGRISIDTPGSKVKRAFGLSYFLDSKANSFELEATCPWKKVLTKGSFSSDPKARKASGLLTIDDSTYQMTFKMDKREERKKITWTPSLKLMRPKTSPIPVLNLVPETLTVGGSVILSKQYDEVAVDFDVLSSFHPISLKLQANMINKKSQKTLSSAVIINKKEGYSATVQMINTYYGKSEYPSKIKPTILISAPKWRPFLLSGSIDYKKNRLVKSNLQVMMDKTLKSPVTLVFKVLKSKTKYKVNGKLSSQFATIKSKGFVDLPLQTPGKKGALLSSKITTSYNLPIFKDRKLRRNVVVISSKIHDRSSKSLVKYDANVVLDSRSYQDASFMVTADMSHKNSFTKSVITFRGGPKPKNNRDKSRLLKIETSLNHKLAKEDVDIRYDMQIIYPIKKIEWQINGKHEHHLKNKLSIETYNSFIFAKGKSSELRLKVDQTDVKTLGYHGLLDFSYPSFVYENKKYEGKSYQIVSTIDEKKRKEYTHSLKVKINKDESHSMFTKFKKLDNSNYNLNSQITIDGKEKTRITIKNSLKDRKTKTFVKFEKGMKMYSADTSVSVNDDNFLSTWDVTGPVRRVEGSLEAGQMKPGELGLKFSTLLDADRDVMNKISADFLYIDVVNQKISKRELSTSLETPYEGYKIFSYREFMEINSREKKYEHKVVWAKKENEFSSKIWFLSPVSSDRFQMDFEIITPSEKLRMFRTEIRHKFSPKYIESSLKSKYNKNNIALDMTWSHRWNDIPSKQEAGLKIKFLGAQRDTLEFMIVDFPEDLSFRPIFPKFPKSLRFELMHKNDDITFDNEILFITDDIESKINHHTTYTRGGYMVNLKSQVNIVLEKWLTEPIFVELVHANTLTGLNTTISTTWELDRRAKLDIGSTFMKHDLTLYVHYTSNSPKVYEFVFKEHHNTLNGWSGSSFYQLNRDPRTTCETKYKITKTELQYESRYPANNIVMKAEYGSFPYTASITYSYFYSTWKNIEFEGSVTKNKENDWSSDMRLVTPFEESRNIDVKGNLKSVGTKRWSLSGDISYAVRKNIGIKALAHTDKWDKFELEVTSPWKNIDLDVVSKRQKRNSRTEVKIKYDGDKEISGKLNSRIRKEKSTVSFDLSSPFDVLRTVTLRSSLLNDDHKWKGLVDLKTSNDKLKFFKLDFAHAFKDAFLQNDIDISSSAFGKVATGILVNVGETPEANFTIVAPYINRAMLGFKLLRNPSWVDFHEKIFGEIQGYELDMDIGLKHEKPQTNAWLTFNYPGADKSYVKTSVHRIGNSFMDFDVGGDLQIGKRNKPYTASAQFSYVDGKTALGTTFESPVTKSFSYLLNAEKTYSKQAFVLYGKYGEDYMLDYKVVSEKSDSSFSYNWLAKYLYNGKGHSASFDISEDGEEFSLASNMDDKTIDLKGSYTLAKASDDNENTVDVFLTTSFDNFRDLEAHANIYHENKDINGDFSLEYMDGKEAKLTFDAKGDGNKLTGNGELRLPIKGYEKNTLSYTHTIKKDKVNLNAEAVTGQGENLKATLEVREGEDFIFNLVGPIKEFKTLKIAGKYNSDLKRLNGNVHLQLTLHSKAMTLEYDIDMYDDPVIMTFRVRSPYENFRRVDLTIKQRGNLWHKFSTTSTLSSEKLGVMTLETNVDYKSPSEFDGSATLTSPVKNMENLRLAVNTHMDNEKVNSKLEVEWDVAKEINVKTSFSVDKTNIMSTFDMTTPFEAAKSFNMKVSNSRGKEMNSRSIFVRLNDITHLDVDMTQKIKTYEWTVDMRNPRPMAIKLEGEIEDRTFDGKMFLNWDKNVPQSQFDFTLHFADKSEGSNIDSDFSFKVIHPVRIMGVQYLFRKANNEMQTSGLITWDESRGNTFSYDIGFTDRSSMYSIMYDGHLKVGVPQRSIKVLGSFGDSGSSRTMTCTALWDADKDERKKVILSTSHGYSKQMDRLGLNLNLPSINKQLHVGVSLKRGYGSSIMDSKTEISYSSDPRKKILITNKIINTVLDKDNQEDYNYTMETGLKHPITNIDLEWLSHVSQVKEHVSVGNQLTYLTLNNEQKVFAWQVETESDKSGKLTFTSPVKRLSIVGKQFSVRGRPAFSLELLEEGRKTMGVSANARPQTRQFDATLQYDRDDTSKKMFVSGGFVNDQAAEMTISDDDYVYAKLNVKLNNSHVIHHKLVWKPSMPHEFKTFMSTKVTAFSYTLKEIWGHAVKSVGTEVKAKYMSVSQELRVELGQLFSLITKEMELFSGQLQALKTQMRRIYNRNDLHIRDMGQQIEDALAEILEMISNVVMNYHSYYNAVSMATNEWIKNLKNYPISQMYGKTIRNMIETMKGIRMILEKTLRDVVMIVKDVSDDSFKSYVKISRTIDKKLNSYLQSKQKLAVFKQMMAEKERLSKMGAVYKPKEMEAVDELYIQTQMILEDQFHDLMDRTDFQQMHAMGTEIYQQVKYWNAKRGFGQALTRLLDLSKNLILMEMAKMRKMVMDMKKTRVVYYNPQQGELQFEVHVPLKMKSLTEPPEFEMGRYIKDTYKWIENRIPDANTSVWDHYYKNAPFMNPSEWGPPYEATGYVVGSQHIITFDKTHTDFLSSCSHVLVRDMLNDTFSVVLNYDKNPVRGGIKSLCFNLAKSFSLEITKDYRLTVNNQETEMPFMNELVRVVRDGNTIRVNYINGLEVISDPSLDLYKVIIAGWFHGQTAGLLGKYNNERKDDEDMVEKHNEYEVNRKYCSSKNVAVKPDSNEDVTGICDELFKDNNSKYRPCFKMVDPLAFHDMCLVYMSTMEDNDAVYRVTEQYRAVCRDVGVYMGPMKEYLPCNKEDKFYVDGTDPLYQSADVVFIMEDSKCNQWAASSLTNMVTKIDKALNLAEMKNNRFGLAGYRGIETSVRTMHGKHFGQANIFLKALETLRFEERETEGDLVTAVRTAMKYPFRPGVAKVFVIAPCTSCQVGFLERNLDTALKNKGFMVHILQEQSFSVSDRNIDSRSYRIYGVDNLQPITNRVSYAIPRASVSGGFDDYCNVMAGTTNGSVFDTNFLTKSKNKIQRDFTKSFANKLGWSTKVPPCQKCECDAESEVMECQLCNTGSYLSFHVPSSFNGFIGNLHDVRYDLRTSLERLM